MSAITEGAGFGVGGGAGVCALGESNGRISRQHNKTSRNFMSKAPEWWYPHGKRCPIHDTASPWHGWESMNLPHQSVSPEVHPRFLSSVSREIPQYLLHLQHFRSLINCVLFPQN